MRRIRSWTLAPLAVLASVSMASAADFLWKGPGTNFRDASNWLIVAGAATSTAANPPDDNDRAFIDGNRSADGVSVIGSATVVLDLESGDYSLGELNVGLLPAVNGLDASFLGSATGTNSLMTVTSTLVSVSNETDVFTLQTAANESGQAFVRARGTLELRDPGDTDVTVQVDVLGGTIEVQAGGSLISSSSAGAVPGVRSTLQLIGTGEFGGEGFVRLHFLLLRNPRTGGGATTEVTTLLGAVTSTFVGVGVRNANDQKFRSTLALGAHTLNVTGGVVNGSGNPAGAPTFTVTRDDSTAPLIFGIDDDGGTQGPIGQLSAGTGRVRFVNAAAFSIPRGFDAANRINYHNLTIGGAGQKTYQAFAAGTTPIGGQLDIDGGLFEFQVAASPNDLLVGSLRGASGGTLRSNAAGRRLRVVSGDGFFGTGGFSVGTNSPIVNFEGDGQVTVVAGATADFATLEVGDLGITTLSGGGLVQTATLTIVDTELEGPTTDDGTQLLLTAAFGAAGTFDANFLTTRYEGTAQLRTANALYHNLELAGAVAYTAPDTAPLIVNEQPGSNVLLATGRALTLEGPTSGLAFHELAGLTVQENAVVTIEQNAFVTIRGGGLLLGAGTPPGAISSDGTIQFQGSSSWTHQDQATTPSIGNVIFFQALVTAVDVTADVLTIGAGSQLTSSGLLTFERLDNNGQMTGTADYVVTGPDVSGIVPAFHNKGSIEVNFGNVTVTTGSFVNEAGASYLASALAPGDLTTNAFVNRGTVTFTNATTTGTGVVSVNGLVRLESTTAVQNLSVRAGTSELQVVAPALFTVRETLSLENGATFDLNNNQLTLSGTTPITRTGTGNLQPEGSTVVLAAAPTTSTAVPVAPVTFNNLVLAGNANAVFVPEAALTVNSTLSVIGGAYQNITAGRNLTVGATGVGGLVVTAPGAFDVQNALVTVRGTSTLGGTGTLTVGGAAQLNLGDGVGAASVTVVGNVSAVSLSVEAGSSAALANITGSGTPVRVTVTDVLTFTGATLTGVGELFLDSITTITGTPTAIDVANFTYANGGVVRALTYGASATTNLNLQSGAISFETPSSTVSGSVRIGISAGGVDAGNVATVTQGSTAINVGGSWLVGSAGGDSFVPGTAAVTMTGAGNATVQMGPTFGTFNQFAVNKPGGTLVIAETDAADDLRIAESLTITAGTLSYGGRQLGLDSATYSILTAGSLLTTTTTVTRFFNGLSTLSDITAAGQKLGNVRVEGTLNQDTRMSTFDLTIASGGILQTDNSDVEFSGDLLNQAGTTGIVAGTSTFDFRAGATSIDADGATLGSVVVNVGSGGTVVIADPGLTLTGNLTVSAQSVLEVSDAKTVEVQGATTISGRYRVNAPTSTATTVTSSHLGSVTIANGAFYEVVGDVTGSPTGSIALTFANGLSLGNTATLDVTATRSPTTVRFGGTTVVGTTLETTGPTLNQAVFRFTGSATNLIRLRSINPTLDAQQWFLTYNRVTATPGTSDLKFVEVSESNASAANLVRADDSQNEGERNENWDFGGNNSIAGTLQGFGAGVNLKLVVTDQNGNGREVLTARTELGGTYEFNFSFTGNDRFAVFVNNATFTASTVGLASTTTASLSGVDLFPGFVTLRSFSTSIAALSPTILGSVDANATADADAGFAVNGGNVALNGGIGLRLDTPVAFATTGNLTIPGSLLAQRGAVSVAGALTVSGTSTIGAGTGSSTVSVLTGGSGSFGQVSFGVGGSLVLRGNTTFSGALDTTNGTLDVGAIVATANGNVMIPTGTLTPPTGGADWTLLLSGSAAQTVSSTPALRVLTVQKSGGSTATLGAPLAARTLNMASSLGDTLNLNELGVTVSGDVIISGGEVTNASTISIGGGWQLIGNGQFTHSDSTVTFTGASSQIAGSVLTTFFDVEVASGASLDINASTNVAGQLSTVGSGGLTLNTGTLTLQGSGSPLDFANPANIDFENAGIVVYAGASSTPITVNTGVVNSSVDYFHLQIVSTASSTVFVPSQPNFQVLTNLRVATGTLALAAGTVSVIRDLSIEADGRIDAATGSVLAVDRNWAAAGANSYAGAGTAAVLLSGSGAATLTSGGMSFRNLVVEKLGSAGRTTATGAVSVLDRLGVDDGELRLAGNDLTVGLGTGATGTIAVGPDGVVTQHLDSTGGPVATGTVTLRSDADGGLFQANGPVTLNNLSFTADGSARTAVLSGSNVTEVRGTLTVDDNTELEHRSGLARLLRSSAAVLAPFVVDTTNGASYDALSAAPGDGTATLEIRSTVADTGGSVQVPAAAVIAYNNLTLRSTVANTTSTVTGAGASPTLIVRRDLLLERATTGTFDQNGIEIEFVSDSLATLTTAGETFDAIEVNKPAPGRLTVVGNLTLDANQNLTVTDGELALGTNDLTLNGGNLVVNTASTAKVTAASGNDVTLNGGTHTGAGALQPFNLTTTGVVVLDVVTTVGGSLTNTGTLTVNAALNVNGTTTLTNSGEIIANDVIVSAGPIVNNANAEFTANDDVTGTTLTNSGTFIANANLTVTSLTNSATFTFDGTTLSVSPGGITNTGAFVASNGAVNVAGGFTASGGTVSLDGATTLDVGGAITHTAAGGFDDGTGTLTVVEAASISSSAGALSLGASNASTTITGAVSTSGTGSITLRGNPLTAGSASHASSGTMDLLAGASGTLTINGALSAAGTAATATTTINAATAVLGATSLTGVGGLDASSAVAVTVNGDLTHTGSGAFVGGTPSGSSLTVTGSFSRTGTPGAFTAPLAEMTVSGATFSTAPGGFTASDLTRFNRTGGAQDVQLGTNVLESFTVSSGGISVTNTPNFEFQGAGTLNGDATIVSGNLRIDAADSLAGTGTFTVENGSLLATGGGPGTQGTINVPFVYRGTGTSQTAASRAYGASLTITTTGTATTFQLDGNTSTTVATGLTVSNLATVNVPSTVQSLTVTSGDLTVNNATVSAGTGLSGGLNVDAGSLVVTGAAPSATFGFTSGAASANIDGNLTVTAGTLDLGNFSNVTVEGNIAQTGGTFVAPGVGVAAVGTLVLDGAANQSLTLINGVENLTIAKGAGSTANLLSDLDVNGAFTVNSPFAQGDNAATVAGAFVVGTVGSYTTGGNSLITLDGTATATWNDQTGTQNFGDVVVTGLVSLISAVTVEDFEVGGGGSFTAGNNQITVRGTSWSIDSASGTFAAVGSTVRFAGSAQPVTIDTGGDAFNNLIIAKANLTDLVTVSTSTLTVNGNLDVTTGRLVIDDVDSTVLGATTVARQSRLDVVDDGDGGRFFDFIGALTLATGLTTTTPSGGFFAYENTATTTATSTLTFESGIQVGQFASFRVLQTGSGTATAPVDVLFGVGSNSRVGPNVPDNLDTVTVFELQGATSTPPGTSPTLRLSRDGGTGLDQWFLAYNIQTSTSTVDGPIDVVSVFHSDANAGNLVRATSSKNGDVNNQNGNNENWSFTGNNVITGIVRNAAGAISVDRVVKLVRVTTDTTPVVESLTAQTDATGRYTFDATLQQDDRIVVFTDNDAAFRAAVVTVVDQGTGGGGTPLQLDLRQGRVFVRDDGAAAMTTAQLNAVDAAGAQDADIPFNVDDATGELIVSGRLVIVGAPATTLTLTGAVTSPGPLDVEGGATLQLAASRLAAFGNTTVTGTLSGASGAETTITGSLTVSAGGLYTGSTGARTTVTQATSVEGAFTGGAGSIFELQNGISVATSGTLTFGGGAASTVSGNNGTFEGSLVLLPAANVTFVNGLGSGSGSISTGADSRLTLGSALNVASLVLGNAAQVAVNGGTGGDLTVATTFTLGDAATATVASDVTVGGATVSIGAGAVVTAGASVTLPGAVTATAWTLNLAGAEAGRALTAAATMSTINVTQSAAGQTLTLNNDFTAAALNVTLSSTNLVATGRNLVVTGGANVTLSGTSAFTLGNLDAGGVTAVLNDTALWSLTSLDVTGSGNLALSGTGTGALEPGPLTVGGNLTNTGPSVRLGNAGAPATVGVTGNLSYDGGAFEASTVTVTGTAAFLGADTANATAMTTGALTVSGPRVLRVNGAQQVNGNATLAADTGSWTPNTVNITGSYAQTGGTFNVAGAITTAFSVTGGFSLVDGTFNAQSITGAQVVGGTFTQSGGTYNGGPELTVTLLATVSGGTMNAATTTTLNAGVAVGGGTIVFEDGDLFDVNGDFTQTGGSYNSTSTTTARDVTTDVSGSLAFSGSRFHPGEQTTIGGSLALSGLTSAVFDGTGRARIDVGDDVLLNGATFRATDTVTLEGDWLLAAGADFFNNSGLVVFETSGNITGSSESTFFDITVESGASVTVVANTNIDGVVTVGGSLSLGGARVTLSASNPLQPQLGGTIDAQVSTVIYDNVTSSTVTVLAIDYHNLTVDSDLTTRVFSMNPTGNRTVSSNILIEGGTLRFENPAPELVLVVGNVTVQGTPVPGRLDLQQTDLNVDGNWTVFDGDSLVFNTTAPVPVVNFTGTVLRQIQATSSTGTTTARFPNLVVEKAGSGRIAVAGNTQLVDVFGDLEVADGLLDLANRDLVIGGGDVTVRTGATFNQGANTAVPTAGAVTMQATGTVLVEAGGIAQVFDLRIDDDAAGDAVTTSVQGPLFVFDTVQLAGANANDQLRLTSTGVVELRRATQPVGGPFFVNFDQTDDFRGDVGSRVVYRDAAAAITIDGQPIVYSSLEAHAAAGSYALSEAVNLTGDLITTGAFSAGTNLITFVDDTLGGSPTATASVLSIATGVTTPIADLIVNKSLGGTVTLGAGLVTVDSGDGDADALTVTAGTFALGGQAFTSRGGTTVANAATITSAAGNVFTLDTVNGAAILTVDGAGANTGAATFGTLRTTGANAATVDGGRITATIADLDAATTMNANPVTVVTALTVDAASSLGAGARLVLQGAPNPLTANAALTIAANATDLAQNAEVDYEGTGTINVRASAQNVARYGVLRLSGSGLYRLESAGIATQVLADSGVFEIENLAFTVDGALAAADEVAVAAPGEVIVESTLGTGTLGTLSLTSATPSGVNVAGTLRLLGARTAAPTLALEAEPDFPARVLANVGGVEILIGDTGRLEANKYRIESTALANGSVRIAPLATLLGGNDALREGRFELTSGTGLAIDMAISNQNLLFQEVRFNSTGGAGTNLRHRTTLGGGGTPANTLRFTNTVLDDPRAAAADFTRGFPGNLWGDESDDDLRDQSATSTLSRGSVLWEDSKAPEILTIRTFDLYAAGTPTSTVSSEATDDVVLADGAIDRIKVVFDEPVDIASVNPAGFTIDGVTAASRVTQGDSATTIVVEWARTAQVSGTAEKTISYNQAAGGIRDAGGNLLATTTTLPFAAGGRGIAGQPPLSIDAAGPVLSLARYDNNASVLAADDEIHITFSEPVAAVGANDAARFVLTGTAEVFGAAAPSSTIAGSPTTTTIITTGFANVPGQSTRIALDDLAFTDVVTTGTANQTPALNEALVLKSFDGDGQGIQAFDLRITPSATQLVAGNAVAYTVEALDREGQVIPGFQPRGGLRFEILRSDGTVSVDDVELRTRENLGAPFNFGQFSNFRPFTAQGGVTITFSDTATHTDADLLPPTDFSGRPAFTAKGGLNPAGTFAFSGSSFILNLENTKATINSTASTARAVAIRVTEIDTGTSNIKAAADGFDDATGPLAAGGGVDVLTVAWEHGAPSRVLTLLGDDTLVAGQAGDFVTSTLDADAEQLFQGVRNQRFDIAVQTFLADGTRNPPGLPAILFERRAGEVFAARVVQTDAFFNITTSTAAVTVSVDPATADDDRARLANLANARGVASVGGVDSDAGALIQPDINQQATSTLGVASVDVKNFLASLDHRLLSSSPQVPDTGRVPSNRYNIFPGPTFDVVLVLPEQLLVEGVPDRELNPVTPTSTTVMDVTQGRPFGPTGQAGQGTPFVVMAVALDRHGNVNFQHERDEISPTSTTPVLDAIVLKALDTTDVGAPTTTTVFESNDPTFPLGQRFGLLVSGIDAAQQVLAAVPPDPDLDLELNRPVAVLGNLFPAPGATPALGINLDGRLTGTEITEALRDSLRNSLSPIRRNADVLQQARFRRYLIRSGAVAGGAADTSSVFVRSVSAAETQAEVNLLKLGDDFADAGTGAVVPPFVPNAVGRGSIGQTPSAYTQVGTVPAELAGALAGGTPAELALQRELRFTHGVAFFQAVSNLDTVVTSTLPAQDTRVLRAQVARAIDGVTVFDSDAFAVGQALLAIDPARGAELRDVGVADGTIDEVEIFFDTTDLVRVGQAFDATRFTLFFNVGGSVVQRSGTTARVGAENSVIVSFQPGLPTTDVSLVTFRIGTTIEGEQTDFNEPDLQLPATPAIDVIANRVLVDKAPPAVISTGLIDSDQNGFPDFLEVVFSESVEFSAGRAIAVSGINPGETTTVGQTLLLSVTTSTGALPTNIVVAFNANSLGAGVAADIQDQGLGLIEAAFQDDRYVLRTLATGSGAQLTVTGGTAAATLKLDAATGLQERPGTDAGLIGEVEDFLVLAADGTDLRLGGAGSVFVDGRRVVVALRNDAGDLLEPLFVVADNLNGSFLSDALGNQATGLLSSVQGLAGQNNAAQSGFLRIRDNDANPADGVITVQPGPVTVDLGTSVIDVAVLDPDAGANTIRFEGVVPPSGLGVIPPAILRPVQANPGVNQTIALGGDLGQSQVEMVLLTAGTYTFRYRVAVDPNAVPLGIEVEADSSAAGVEAIVRRDFTIQVVDVAPRAEVVEGPFVVAVSQDLLLDASGSSDANGDALTFQWSVVSEPLSGSATFDDDGIATPTLTATAAGIHVLRVTVTDPGNQSATADVTVFVQAASGDDQLPTADAGTDIVVRTGAQFQLDGRQSVDPEGGALTFAWAQVGGNATASVVQPTLVAPLTAGVLTFRLVVSDGASQASLPDTVDVIVIDDDATPSIPPFATFDVLPAGLVTAGDRVLLDGSGSQATPRVGEYRWTQVGGPGARLVDSGDTALVTTAEALPGTYVFQLVCADPSGLAGRAFRREIQVLPVGALAAPTASIVLRQGATPVPDNTVDLAGGASATLTLDATLTDATSSTVSFAWRQLGGPLTPLSDPTAEDPTLTVSVLGAYAFEVAATDGNGIRARARLDFVVGSDDPDPLQSQNDDLVPIAQFDAPQSILLGQSFGLAGFGSEDPDGGGLEFVFEQTEGLPVFLNGKPGVAQTGTPLADGRYTFRLFVIDGEGRRSAPVTQSLDVAPNPAFGGPIASSGSGGGGGGGCQASSDGPAPLALPLLLAALALALLRGARRVGRALAAAAPAAALAVLLSGCGAGIIAPVIIALSSGGGGGAADVTQPDLVLSSTQGPAVATVITEDDPTNADPLVTRQRVVFRGLQSGEGGALETVLINGGNDIAPAGTQIAWYLSRTKQIGAQSFRVRTEGLATTLDIGAAMRIVSSDPGDQAVEPETDDAVLEPGTYFLLARANDNNGIAELDTANNDDRSAVVVQVYGDADAVDLLGGSPDIAISRVLIPTAVIAGTDVTGSVTLTNLNASTTAATAITLNVRLSTDQATSTNDVLVATATATLPVLGAIESQVSVPFTFQVRNQAAQPVAGRFFVEVEVTGLGAQDGNTENNRRFSSTPLVSSLNTTVFAPNGAVLPFTQVGDPVVLQIATERPAINTFLAPGAQRLLAFEIPDNNLAVARSQAIINVQSTEFDPVVELLSPAGSSVVVLDDFAGDTRAVLYASLSTPATNRTFFLAVTGAGANDTGNFTVSIDVNPGEVGDDQAIGVFAVGDLLGLAPTNVEVDLSAELVQEVALRQAETEVFFVVPARGRFPIEVRETRAGLSEADFIAIDPQNSTLVRYDARGVPTEIPFVLERIFDTSAGAGFGGFRVLSSEKDGLFTLDQGEYIMLFRTSVLPDPLEAPYQFVIGAGLQFGSANTLPTP